MDKNLHGSSFCLNGTHRTGHLFYLIRSWSKFLTSSVPLRLCSLVFTPEPCKFLLSLCSENLEPSHMHDEEVIPMLTPTTKICMDSCKHHFNRILPLLCRQVAQVRNSSIQNLSDPCKQGQNCCNHIFIPFRYIINFHRLSLTLVVKFFTQICSFF